MGKSHQKGWVVARGKKWYGYFRRDVIDTVSSELKSTIQKIQEMQTYSWDAKAAQRGEEKPLKIRDHGPDAFRYFAKSEVPYWRLSGG